MSDNITKQDVIKIISKEKKELFLQPFFNVLKSR